MKTKTKKRNKIKKRIRKVRLFLAVHPKVNSPIKSHQRTFVLCAVEQTENDLLPVKTILKEYFCLPPCLSTLSQYILALGSISLMPAGFAFTFLHLLRKLHFMSTLPSRKSPHNFLFHK